MTLATIFALSVLLGGAQAPSDDVPGICKAGLLHVQQGALPELMPDEALPAVGDTDVLHYDLDLEIIPGSQWLGGTNTITARSLVDGLTSVEIRLHNTFTISTVESGAIPTPWVRLSSSTIEVTLDRAYDTGEEFEIFIAYEGNPVSLGFGSISFSSHGGFPLVSTLSEPWYAYTWWPAKDDNTDKATGTISLTVPDTLTVAANGLLVSVDPVGGGRDRYRWHTDYQTATYLFSFSAARYNTFSGTYVYEGGTMPAEFFIFPDDDTTQNRDLWLQSVDMIEVYSGLFGLYPFVDEKYGIYQFGFGGGMEHQTMTGQGGFSTWLTAHELTHQWFGDMITCGTWQDIWLNEGFATYGEALWEEFKPGSSGTPALHAHMAARRPSSYNGSVYVPAEDAGNVNRIFSGNYSYDKGAWVLHQLRHVVGDQAFFDILAAYRAAFEYDSATTDDFQAIAESVYGGDLAWFFDPWVYGIGAPQYAVAWQQHSVGGRNYVELYLSQVQPGNYPIFTMPLDVVMQSGAGELTDVAWSDAAAEHLLLETAASITDLEIDPDNWVLRGPTQTAAWVEGPPKVVTVVPEPGEEIPTSGSDLTIEVTFHKDVTANAGHFFLAGDTVGSVPFGYSYDTVTQVASLTVSAPVPADSYTLTVDDGIVDVVAGLALDGEVADPSDPAALPGGDGLPGGDAVIQFAVIIPGDVDRNGTVNVADLLALLGAWGPCVPPGDCPADFDGDGTVGVTDLLTLLGSWS